MDIKKEWERDPPPGPMNTMTALWYDFKRRRRDPKSPVCYNRDNIPDACALDPTPEAALSRAVRSIRPNGKMHNHQAKVSRSLPEFEDRLMMSLKSLIKAETFGQLYTMIELRSGHGIGPMTIYDVATRFGAYLGVKPQAIYLHAGTLAGLKELKLNTKGCLMTFPMELLPAILRNKDPDEVEDFLCTYRLAFERLK